MSREHARPQPPAGSRRYGGGAGEPAPVPVGVTGHRTQRPRGQVGPPGPHPAQPSSSLNPGGDGRPIPPPMAPLIAQLVLRVVCVCLAASIQTTADKAHRTALSGYEQAHVKKNQGRFFGVAASNIISGSVSAALLFMPGHSTFSLRRHCGGPWPVVVVGQCALCSLRAPWPLRSRSMVSPAAVCRRFASTSTTNKPQALTAPCAPGRAPL
jgi:hypothetical protein